ncbi:MAG: SDR family oxidoreductase [Pseudomonadota bacterium]
METHKVVLVTGAGSGFGKCIALALAKEGWLVYASMRAPQGRNRARAQALLAACPERIRVVELDVGDDASAAGGVARVIQEAGRIDVLVNNAGIMFQGVSEAYDMAQARDIMETNFFSAVRMDRLVLPQMRRQRGGVLLHITSIAGSIVFPFAGLYSASKMATEGLAESYRYELRQFGIDSLVIQPCPYPTALLDSQQAPADAERLAAYGEQGRLPEQRIASTKAWHQKDKAPDPDEVAQSVCQLLAMPFGERPFRSVAGTLDFGTSRLNDVRAEVQAGVAGAFGF